MSSISVDLPPELLRFVESIVQQGRFATASEYIAALVDTARNKRSEIEAALMESLESGPAEDWTSQEWGDMKQRLHEHHPQV